MKTSANAKLVSKAWPLVVFIAGGGTWMYMNAYSTINPVEKPIVTFFVSVGAAWLAGYVAYVVGQVMVDQVDLTAKRRNDEGKGKGAQLSRMFAEDQGDLRRVDIYKPSFVLNDLLPSWLQARESNRTI